MFKETMMPGSKEKESSSEKNSQVKEDYEKGGEIKFEIPSKKWADVPKELQEEIIARVGDEFTVKFVELNTAFDEMETYPRSGSIKLVDKEGKSRSFHITEKVDSNRNRTWTIKEAEEKEAQ